MAKLVANHFSKTHFRILLGFYAAFVSFTVLHAAGGDNRPWRIRGDKFGSIIGVVLRSVHWSHLPSCSVLLLAFFAPHFPYLRSFPGSGH